MLVATYALMALSVRQDEERRCVYRLRRYLTGVATSPDRIDPSFLVSQLEKLALLAESRQGQTLVNRLIPAIREATPEAGPLLSRLDALNRSGRALLGVMRKSACRMHAHGKQHILRLCGAMEAYCRTLLERLEREEKELLPLAQRVVPSEAWFAIGASFLEEDALRKERRRTRQPLAGAAKSRGAG